MSKNIPIVKTPNLKIQVYELLLNWIVEGKYKVNDMLPPVRILCEELGVSRTVIREAVNSLETRGVIKVIHGKGIKVTSTTSTDISNAFMLYLKRQNSDVSMKDLMEVRYAIETEIARYAALRAKEDDIDKLDTLLKKMGKTIEDIKNFNLIDQDYHLNLAYITHNMVFITIIEALVIPLRKIREETGSVKDNILAFNEHVDIFNCIKSNDAEKARILMDKHLKHVEKILLEHGKL